MVLNCWDTCGESGILRATTRMHRNSDRMKNILRAANQVEDPTLEPEEPNKVGDITNELVEEMVAEAGGPAIEEVPEGSGEVGNGQDSQGALVLSGKACHKIPYMLTNQHCDITLVRQYWDSEA